MGGVRAPLPLAPFSFDWIGGDIRGLSALAGQCYDIAPQITAAASRLNDTVKDTTGAIGGLSGTRGWNGAAASAFSTAWGNDATASLELAQCWGQIGGIVDVLAAELAKLENEWEQEARAVSEIYGVNIDGLTGQVSSQPTISAPQSAPSGACVPSQLAPGAARAFEGFVAQILAQAGKARALAAGALDGVGQALLPPGFDSGQLTADLDGLRSIWATPTAVRAELEADAAKVHASIARIRAAFEDTVRGTPSEAQAELDRLFEEGQGSEANLITAFSKENPSTALAAGDPVFLEGLPDAVGGVVKAIPFVGTTVGAGITIWQDIEAGDGPARAVSDGVVSSGASLAVGTIVGEGVAAGVATVAGVVLAPEVAVGVGAVAGVVGGGAAAVGVGDFIHHLFQENWTLERQQYGVLGGTWHGVADSYDGTRHDLAHYADDLNPFNW